MSDTHRSSGAGLEDTPFHVMFARHRSLLQVKSWLPEHNAGRQAVCVGGCELPREVGATLPSPLHALCLSPCEWLLVLDEPCASSVNRLSATPLEVGVLLLNVTDGLAALRVRGRAARDVLAKGCGLDFYPQAFPAGRCARTRLAQMPVVIDCIDEFPSFDLYVARSHQRFLGDWLEDAAAEFTSSQP